MSAKTRFDLIPFAAVGEIADVLAYGAEKYSANNWCRGTEWGRYFSALCRHIFAWWRGEDRDPETGFSHLAHAGCCLLFLMEYQRNAWGTDDRFSGPDGQSFTKYDGRGSSTPIRLQHPAQQGNAPGQSACWVGSDGLQQCATTGPSIYDDDDGLD
jgi:hypothetical protein